MIRTATLTLASVLLLIGAPALAESSAKAAPDQRGGASKFAGRTSGFEGREDALGRAMSTVIKTLKDTEPYQHEMNDALVKALLNQMQFAKDRGLMAELIDHDRQILMPMLLRTKKYIEKTGNVELALVAMFDRTTCHYQLVDETITEPGRRIYRSPYKTVLDVTRRLEQFDMTEEWIHDNWTVPRFMGMAAAMGVTINVSPWNSSGTVTVEVIDPNRVAANDS